MYAMRPCFPGIRDERGVIQYTGHSGHTGHTGHTNVGRINKVVAHLAANKNERFTKLILNSTS